MSTNVPANAGVTISGSVGPKISESMVLATPNTPIPAVTLKHRTIHSRKNCGVFVAWLTPTVCREIMLLWAASALGGVQPEGCQFGGGRRYENAAASITSR